MSRRVLVMGNADQQDMFSVPAPNPPILYFGPILKPLQLGHKNPIDTERVLANCFGKGACHRQF